jgi:tetratricopeptide (TPR) repeat protein
MIPGDQPGIGQAPGANLTPPGRPPGPSFESTSKHGLIYAALAVVVILGLGVLFVLPKMVSENVDEKLRDSTTQDPAAITQAPASEGQDQAVSRTVAAKALQDFLMTRARLELANAPIWGEPQWSQAIDAAAKGDAFFSQRQFAEAKTAFVNAKMLLESLASESAQRLVNALASGWQALELNDSESAIEYFKVGLSIDDENEEANRGLQRARIRPDLMVLMDSGDLALSMNNLQKAQAVYFEAVELDGVYEPAQIALQDVTEQIIDLEFKAAMSRALTAIEKQQPEKAGAALQQAASLKPNEQVVGNTRYQLQQLKQKLWLADQRRTAANFAAKESWSDAVTVYKKVLARTPQAGFAGQGLEHAQDRARLHQQLDHYLDDPGRVYSTEPRVNAEKLLASAGKPPEDEPRLAEKIQRLQGLIVQAQTPAIVTLQSDGLTNIVIFHVGRLGSFSQHQLELPPGTYTVVGSRQGYRDVRKTLTVKPGADQTNLVIQCEETV